ncbi:hypothetical protein NDU88_009083 [Pleurodeles waltl]|uniref:Uncharacterized protein n=1 Tax=Pleurodeles waltl TaxID=8319 RepID=A0AAV7NY12_PLEWA|nr:hypothetical protein NDU88_009083 [Pleurodeles waltl]
MCPGRRAHVARTVAHALGSRARGQGAKKEHHQGVMCGHNNMGTKGCDGRTALQEEDAWYDATDEDSKNELEEAPGTCMCEMQAQRGGLHSGGS